MRRLINQKDKKQIIKLYTENVPIHKIMSATGWSNSSIYNVVRGLRRQLPKDQSIRNQYIIDKYLKTFNTKAIATELNISWVRVYQILQDAGVTRTPEEYTRKYWVHDNYFDHLTKESAYWLGFILADGCITDDNQFKITLSEKDIKHLYKLKDILSEAPIKKSYKTIGNTSYPLVTLQIRSKKLCNSLRSAGITERKSTVHGTPVVHKSLKPSFYLGYFDGDGCICKPKNRRGHTYVTSIASSEKFCKELQKWATSQTSAKYHVSSIGRIWEARGATETSIRFLTHLYKSSPERLERKFLRYKQAIIDHDSNRSRTKPKLGSIWNDAIKLCGL